MSKATKSDLVVAAVRWGVYNKDSALRERTIRIYPHVETGKAIVYCWTCEQHLCDPVEEQGKTLGEVIERVHHVASNHQCPGPKAEVVKPLTED